MRRLIKAVLPHRYHEPFGFAAHRIMHAGGKRVCPRCESRLRRFRPYGVVRRREARCPVCYSLERHRLLSLYFRAHPELLTGSKRLLHVAPEGPVARLMQRNGEIDHVTVDLEARDVMLAMDITKLGFPDNLFDGIYCSHVLEHVADDRAAMTEFRRVMRPDAWLILQVPVAGEITREDPSITDPAERRRLFGQADHVRLYGRDFRERLEASGFAVNVEDPTRRMKSDEIQLYGLAPAQNIFICRKG